MMTNRRLELERKFELAAKSRSGDSPESITVELANEISRQISQVLNPLNIYNVPAILVALETHITCIKKQFPKQAALSELMSNCATVDTVTVILPRGDKKK